MSEIAYPRYALAFALVLVLGLAVVTAHSALIRGHRAALEHWSQETAVGDQHLYPVGPDAPAVTFHSKALTPISPEPHDVRETRVLVVGEDDSKRFRIYLHHEPGSREPDNDQVYLLKTGQNEFLKMQFADKK